MPHQSELELERIVRRLLPILWPAGFEFELSELGVNSGGSFAAGFFSRPPIRIGLIVRGARLGMPNYVLGSGVSMKSHCDLVRVLRCENEPLLKWDEDNWRLVGEDGQDVVEALAWDLSNIILPAIDAGEGPFREADLVR
ncbi:hypothetical protein Pla163_00840 [Planctomycetes bacterium Pla163]|uniref:Uncharacterized protein n=1 Tax=Rohdeia mirabilis TaxID=2528008 RepID=A0A518CUT4_9BACT|nr:hypothetical protein Pla163_00840 [Planctomycetes bacterium Pla163]